MWEDLIFDWTDLLLVLISGGACTVLLYVAIGILREFRTSRRWPQTTGTVISSRVEARQKNPHDAEVASLPLVEYEYKIGAGSSRGWGIYVSVTSSEHGLKRVRERYPVGGQVIVRYNPADPRQAMLEGDVSESGHLGGFLLLLSVGMAVVALLLDSNAMLRNVIFMLIFYSVVPVGLMVVMIAKYREIRAAQCWSQTTGTVLTSCVESRKKVPGDNDSDTAVMNLPNVMYKYQVNDQSFRGSRIDLGQRTSENELESILDRYPVGAPVVVYYNPADPQDAVLERDVPAGTFWIGGGCVFFSIAVPIIAILIYYKAIDWFDGGAIVAGGMGLATLGHAIAYTATSAQASRWPTTRGRIVFAGVDEFRSRRRTHFRHSVRYTYEVNGRQFLGDRVHIAAVISSTIPWLAWLSAEKYPVGMEVDVHYNLQKPSESVLHPWSLWGAVPWLIFVGLFGLGWALGGGK